MIFVLQEIKRKLITWYYIPIKHHFPHPLTYASGILHNDVDYLSSKAARSLESFPTLRDTGINHQSIKGWSNAKYILDRTVIRPSSSTCEPSSTAVSGS